MTLLGEYPRRSHDYWVLTVWNRNKFYKVHLSAKTIGTVTVDDMIGECPSRLHDCWVLSVLNEVFLPLCFYNIVEGDKNFHF